MNLRITVDELIQSLQKLDTKKYITIGKEGDCLGHFDYMDCIVERRCCGFNDEDDEIYYALCGKDGL